MANLRQMWITIRLGKLYFLSKFAKVTQVRKLNLWKKQYELHSSLVKKTNL